MHFDIDLAFSVKLPSTTESGFELVSGTVTAAGKLITVKTDSLTILPSAKSINRSMLGQVALKLKKAGVTLQLEGPTGTIVSLGDVKPHLLSRLGASSSAIRFGKPAAAAALLRQPVQSRQVLPMQVPATLLPLLPTFLKQYRRKPTTTHYSRGGGKPRIIFVKDSDSWDGKAPKMLEITQEVLEIGSDPSAGLLLSGLKPTHARIVHNELDEYVLVAEGAVGGSVGLKPGSEYTLRSGARIELGQWRLIFHREEYADHGRPFGGRNGGELSFQKPQFNPRTGLIERDSSE